MEKTLTSKGDSSLGLSHVHSMTIADAARIILPKYYDLVVELISSFPHTLAKGAAPSNILFTSISSQSHQGPIRSQTEILEDILFLDEKLKFFVDKLIRHIKIYNYYKEYKFRKYNLGAATLNFYMGINELKSSIIDALYYTKLCTTPVLKPDKQKSSLDVNELVVYAARLSNITSFANNLKFMEAPLPQEYHARSSMLFDNKPKLQVKVPEPQIIDEEASEHSENYNSDSEYHEKIVSSPTHSDETREKWLDLEL